MTPTTTCWCGNTDLLAFSPNYRKCSVCETLVTMQMPEPDIAHVEDDDQDFYGRNYWFAHQEEDLGYTNIVRRARSDLPERCLHWLRAALKYKLPPGQALELGSAHGGFVALLRWAGFHATGLELSPSIVQFASETFDVPMLLGPVEQQSIAPGSLDLIALMDVLEHLPDPVGTMRSCLEKLAPTGILLIQTPGYRQGRLYQELLARQDPFLEQLKANEHLYLFNQDSIGELFRRLGACHLAFEPAIFGHYDMFCIVSRAPLATYTQEQIEQALSMTPNGRMIQALLDLDSDRAAHLEVIKRQGAELGRIPALETDIEYLKKQVIASEADRAARLAVIERQGAELGRIPALEADVEHLKKQVIASEADRAARLAVIERQGAELGQLRQRLAQIAQHLDTLDSLLVPRRTGAVKALLRPQRRRRLWAALDAARALSHPDDRYDSSSEHVARCQLDAYIAEIDRFNRSQSNSELLDRIRAYNHTTIEAFNGIRPLRQKRLLDIGASPHGYALEHALRLGVAEYVGIGLDIAQPVEVQTNGCTGKLLAMNAEQLGFEAERFDLVISISTFEHISDVPRALAEIRRVLKTGGSALITFEPLWTSSYGHHLHHFGPVSALVPDWAHLVWTSEQMQAELAPVWPADAPITLEQAVEWTYEGDAINRVGITTMRDYFFQSGLRVEWIEPLMDEKRDSERLRTIAATVGLTETDLMTKGLSVLLHKD